MHYFSKKLRTLVVAFAFVLLPLSSFAITPTEVPTSVDPSQLEGRLSTPVMTMPELLPAAQIQGIPSQPPLPAEAKKIKLRLGHLILDGNTAIDESELKQLYQDKLQQNITLYDLQKIAQDITVYYRNKGYILSRAVMPPQHIDSKFANVTIQIVEGFVDHVYIKGKITTANKYRSTKDVLRSYGQRIARERPLNIATLERFALLANDIPGLNVRAVLRPSSSTPGAANLIFYVSQSRAKSSLTFNNRGTRYLGPVQGFVDGSVHSVLMGGDTTGLRGVKVPHNSSMSYIEFFHEHPWGTNGLLFHVSYDKTKTNPRFKLESFDMNGILTTITSSLSFPVIRSRALNWYLHGRAHYIDSRTKILSDILYDDRLRTLTLGTSFNASDHFRGYNAIAFDWVHGFKMWGATRKDSVEKSRPRGKSNFDKVMLTLSRIQNFNHRWSMLFSLDGQVSADHLLSPEQISVGGGFYGQAYDPSEISADTGGKGRAELRFDFLHTPTIHQSQVFIAYDYGSVIYLHHEPGESIRQTLSSYGGGWRLNLWGHMALTLEAARPVAREVDTLKLSHNNPKRWRYFANVSMYTE